MKLKQISLKVIIAQVFFVGIILISSLIIVAPVPTVSAQAACNYQIKFSSDTKAVTTKGQIRLTAIVTRGSISGCGMEPRFHLTVRTKNNPNGESLSGLPDKTQAFNGSEANVGYTVYVDSDITLSDLLNPGNIDFQMSVYNGQTKVTNSSILTVVVSGTTSSQGALSVSADVQKANTIFKAGETTDVLVKFNNLSSLDSSIQNINAQAYVNGTKINLSDTDTREDLTNIFASGNSWDIGSLTISTANGFKNGSNTVTVKAFQAGQSLELGEGSITVQSSSLSTTPSTTTKPTTTATTPTTGGTASTNANGTAVNCSGQNPDPTRCLYNPLPTGNLTTMFLWIAKGTLGITSIWAVMFIIIGGFQMITSAGNEEAYGAGKRTVLYSILGVIVAILSFTAVEVVQNLLRANITASDVVNTTQGPSNTSK